MSQQEQSSPITESTPLSAPTSHKNYSSTNLQQQAEDSVSGESSDSGGGYVSGSGRRESAFEGVKHKSSRSLPHSGIGSPRNAPSPGQKTSTLSWTFNKRDHGSRTQSPGNMLSPRSGPTVVPPSPGSPPSRTTTRRRSSKQQLQDQDSIVPHPSPQIQQQQGASSAADRQDNIEEEDSWAWFMNLISRFGAIELDNKGSVARDHLALERTFLAWLRTSLAFASIGIAITQLFRLNSTLRADDPAMPIDEHPLFRLRNVGKPLGTTFLAVSIVILLIGFRRYFESQYWIIRGKFPASRGSVFLVTGVAAALIVISLVVVVIVGRVT